MVRATVNTDGEGPRLDEKAKHTTRSFNEACGALTELFLPGVTICTDRNFIHAFEIGRWGLHCRPHSNPTICPSGLVCLCFFIQQAALTCRRLNLGPIAVDYTRSAYSTLR